MIEKTSFQYNEGGLGARCLPEKIHNEMRHCHFRIVFFTFSAVLQVPLCLHRGATVCPHVKRARVAIFENVFLAAGRDDF